MSAEMLAASSSSFGRRVIAIWEWVSRLTRRDPKRLRLCESLPLGERRFVAVVEFDGARFLLGGTPSSLVLLSRLEDASGGNHCEHESKEALRNVTREIEVATEKETTETKMMTRRGARC